MKRTIKMILCVNIIVALLSGLQYAIYYIDNPVKQEKTFFGTGCLIYGSEQDDYRIVPVAATWNALHYIYGNREDAFSDVKISVNGCDLSGGHGFAAIFYDSSPEAVTCINDDDRKCSIFYAGKEGEPFICGIDNVSEIMESNLSTEVRGGVLVLPADNMEEAKNILSKAVISPYATALKEWLRKNSIF